MSFMKYFLFLIIFFVFLIGIFSYILKFLSNKRFRVSFVLSHLLLISLIAIFVFISRDDAQAEFYWAFAVVIDLPISMLVLLLREILPEVLGSSMIIFPAILFMLFGGFQYYCLGWGVDLLYKKFNKHSTIEN